MDGALREENNVTRLCSGLSNEFRMGSAIDHSGWHFEVALVTARDDTKTTFTGIVIGQHDIDTQQACSNGTMHTGIGQFGIVFARGAVNGPTVQCESFGTIVLCQDKGKMIHTVSLTQDAMEEGHQLGMSENGRKDTRFFGAPFQDATQIFSCLAFLKT